ncbi:MAG: hypothetical protein DWQ35_13870 [Planctomycetota bacterium]|nr:MAG: hypothetical protein DWQ35_13870 [Planctomycetota bacterium]REK25969.1 MAG: hypothetical protein DWQ42_10085 [Planctomycetota bacterium]REK46915.1 MAG: hypothetical protein DWQ46_05315 [Planctomycetota bacterium]
MIGIILGVFTILLGVKAFTSKGLPLTRQRNITGKPKITIGLLCILLGIVFISDGVFASFSILQLFRGNAPVNNSEDLESSKLVGTWSIDTKEVLPNGHYVTGRNLDTYRRDGTFVSNSRSQLIDGDTDQPFVTMRTEESGTWTVKQNQICKHYSDSNLLEFESNVPSITREQIASQMQDDIAKAQPECYAVLSVTSEKVVLRDDESGTKIALIRDSQ